MASNWVYTATYGRVRAVCADCGQQSRPLSVRWDGHPAIAELAGGWVVAPYPITHTHPDGSKGSRFRCPTCNPRLHPEGEVT